MGAAAMEGEPRQPSCRRLGSVGTHLLSADAAVAATCAAAASPPPRSSIDWTALATRSPVILRGDERNAYRDPTAIYHNGVLRLFFTLMQTEPSGQCYSYTATARSIDLLDWTEPVTLTPRSQHLNFGSPGNIVWDVETSEWVLCLQTYPRPNGEKFGNQDSRLFTMRSTDLEAWSEPELIRVKGESVAEEDMGRMIDPYLLENKDEPGTWFCFFKQNGVSVSVSTTGLRGPWEFVGSAESGENVCCLVDSRASKDTTRYLLFHSPANGVGIKQSADPRSGWSDDLALLTFGQDARAPAAPGEDTTGWAWPWAAGRLTAGFVLPAATAAASMGTKSTAAAGFGLDRSLMFFHASDFAEADQRGGFDNFASVAMAWTTDPDYQSWDWGSSASG